MCEDPYANVEALINDFVEKYYGPASTHIKAYMQELLRSVAENDNISAFCSFDSAHFSFLDYKAVKNGMALLEKATEAVKHDPVFGPRARYVMTLLGANLLIKYFDLKNIAEQKGETFKFDREAIRQMVVDGFKEAQKHPRCSEAAPATKVANQITFFSNLVILDDEDWAPLPDELAEVNPEDVYQFFYKNSCRHMIDTDFYGVSFVDDPESSLGRVQKICRADACAPLEVSVLLTTSRNAEFTGGITIRIQKDSEYVDGIELFKEDIVPDKYHLYKVGNVSGIQDAGRVLVDIFGNNFEWLHLSGVSAVLPMDACDVYLSIKFAGELYGGSKDVQEAVYLDRAIIVRK